MSVSKAFHAVMGVLCRELDAAALERMTDEPACPDHAGEEMGYTVNSRE